MHPNPSPFSRIKNVYPNTLLQNELWATKEFAAGALLVQFSHSGGVYGGVVWYSAVKYVFITYG